MRIVGALGSWRCAGSIAVILAANSTSRCFGEELALRATHAIPDRVVEYLATAAVPTRAILLAGEAPKDLIERVCGFTSPAYEAAFRSVNDASAFRPESRKRPVNFLPCARVRRNVRTIVLPGETIEGLLHRRVGRGPGDIVVPCSGRFMSDPDCGKTLLQLATALNPGVDLGLLSAKSVGLPLTTQIVTVRLRDGLNAREVSQKITDIAAQEPDIGTYNPIIANVAAASLRLILPKTGGDLAPGDAACSNSSSSSSWPFEVSEASRALSRTIELGKSRDAASRTATIAVLDTGLDAARFPAAFLSLDASGRAGSGFSANDPNPVIGFEPRAHGTQVANLAVGGLGLTRAVASLSKFIRVKAYNLLEGVPTNRWIGIGGVLGGLTYAEENGVSVVNLSVGSEMPIFGFKEKLRASSRMLIVVAAGNDGEELGNGGYSLYPANYGGEAVDVGAQVVTVGAHDGAIGRPSFSNFSPIYADLLAPGCSPGANHVGMPEIPHGTSFAAPLVSFVAAFMSAFELAPKDIKKRLEISVDYNSRLRNVVRFGGVLNIPKAVSLFEDIAQVEGEPMAHGKWTAEDLIDICDGEEAVETRWLKKVSAVEEASKLRLLVEDTQGRLVERFCEPGPDMFRFEVEGRDLVRPWSKVKDLVVRHFPEPIASVRPADALLE